MRLLLRCCILAGLSEDWILYSSEEFGWLELGDGVTSGSSLMPQKKNPDSLELIRGKFGRVFGDLNSLFVIMKGLPMTYNRDMQEDKEPLFDAADQLCGSLEMAREVVATAKLRPERPAQAAEESWVVATDLAEALARSGTPFHQAHQIAGRLVLESVRSWQEAVGLGCGIAEGVRAGVHSGVRGGSESERGNEDAGDCGGHRAGARECGAGCGGGASQKLHAMNKSYRQSQILKLIRGRNLHTQDELARALRALKIPATQVTLSRDIRELGLVKTAAGYSPGGGEAVAAPGPDVGALAREVLRDIRQAQNLLVLRTPAGNANALAAALDQADWAEVTGTIAGDDTVLVVAPDVKTADALRAKFLRFLR